jgi:GNAT superfamily N-acetyltransferase
MFPGGYVVDLASMKIETTQNPSSEVLAVLRKGMREYELSVLPDLPDEAEDIQFCAFAKCEKGEVIAGIKTNIFWNGLEIDILWVDPAYRRKGIAARLMREAERAAVENGAVIGYLKTVMAKEFYESLGYSVYGVLEDRPKGTLLYHMKKRLPSEC